MPDITQCPECQRKLNLPDGQLGQLVRCPACGAEFTAERHFAPRPAAAPPPPREPEPPRPPPRRPADYADRDDDRRDDDYPPRRRRYRGYDGYGTNRSSTVQTLGVLSLCLCWIPLICWILGIIAL